jgi:hypothetical protein
LAEATIDYYVLTSDVTSEPRYEEKGHVGYIAGHGQPSQRDALFTRFPNLASE